MIGLELVSDSLIAIERAHAGSLNYKHRDHLIVSLVAVDGGLVSFGASFHPAVLDAQSVNQCSMRAKSGTSTQGRNVAFTECERSTQRP